MIDKTDCEDTTDTAVLFPNWFSSTSLSSMDSTMNSTLNAEDLLHEMVTIEGLRTLYASCFVCGVSWHQNHVTLDCRECGGYAMSRPCPQCDGQCGVQWQRDLTQSHDNHRAVWTGDCKLRSMSDATDKHQETGTENRVRPLPDSSSSATNRPKLIATLKV